MFTLKRHKRQWYLNGVAMSLEDARKIIAYTFGKIDIACIKGKRKH